MPISLKINESIEILDTAISHHLRTAGEKFDRAFWYLFQDNISDDSIRVYSLFYSNADNYLDQMAEIKLRKLGSAKIELTISEPEIQQELQNTLLENIVFDRKLHLREEVIN